MSPSLPRWAQQTLVLLFVAGRLHGARDSVVMGHHRINHVLTLGRPWAFLFGVKSGKAVAKFRTPFPTIEVVPRIWPHEPEVLRAVGTRLTDTPKCLGDFGECSVHSFVPGKTLSEAVQEGTIGYDRQRVLADFFAALADVPLEELPALPDDWPDNGDSTGFLHWLARFVVEHVHRPNLERFGELFAAVGIPEDAMERFMRTAPELTRRPFSLLHTDVHRGNVVLARGPDGEQLVVIDWELALYGDPLHDLATHLVRMDYDPTEREQMIKLWAEAMYAAGHASATNSLEDDLPVYLGFAYAQSVFADVMRAALKLGRFPGEEDYVYAARRVCRAASRAKEPLGLPYLRLDERGAVDALRRWHARDDRVSLVPGSRKGARGWDEPQEDRPQGEKSGNGAIGATWFLISTASLLW